MNTSIQDMKKKIDEYKSGHILYLIDDPQAYLKNAAAYILSGVEQGDHVFVIENDRMFTSLYELVKASLTRTQLDRVHFVNNFDFYYSRGDFHTPTIVAYFLEVVKPIIDAEQSYRTWAHIEWGKLQDIEDEVDAYEINAQKTVHEMDLLSVCAYDKDRLTENMKGSLLNSHDCLMLEDEIVLLNQQDAVGD
ncbi:MEDS domain-containing protein [Metabacillus sp. FJAT-52054]|uniref:MEDS domain-containing protein n=1 Tax=Metabacillus sediminis TaxID=3117746 RepID=A0ABZ2NJU7_9BACI